MKKSVLVLSVLFLVFVLSTNTKALEQSPTTALQDQISSATSKDLLGKAIYLHIGSPLILSQNKISPLDPQNLDVAATIVGTRTLVPLGALSKYFNATVSYDSTGKKAIIENNGKKYLFPIGESKYTEIDGLKKKIISMDTKTMIINNRTMVPLKVICEDILGRKVSYYDKVIAINDTKINLNENKTLISQVKLKIGAALKAQSMEQLKATLAYQKDLNNDLVRFTEGTVSYTQSVDTSQKSSSLASQKDTNYSTTNTQVQGIDEADIVKTNGKYIFIAGNNAVRIVSANKGKLFDTAIIKLPNGKTVNEIYIEENRLVLMGVRNELEETTSNTKDTSESSNKAKPTEKMMPYYSKNYTFIDIYDLSDPKNPVFIKGHEMEGSYQSSRKNGSIVYLITNSYIYNNSVVPMMRDTTVSDKPFILPLKDIMIMPGCPISSYIIVSAIDINNKEKTQVEAITTSGHLIYMNSSSLYLTANNYDGQSTITKFKIDGMNFGYAGSGKVTGYILNQFSMDEYKGYFRVAATLNNENNLYVLDDSLNICGSVTGLAKGERIYSVRFMGDKGYIVTFRTMDPLFVFDLSDPKKPKVTGELKIPGFSNYLHPVGDNLIMGIGQDTYEIFKKDSLGKDIVVGTRQGGIKLSLFDVSDMGKPKEVSNYVLGDSGSYTDVFYNHKAVMFDYSNNNVVFDASITDTNINLYKHGAAVFNFDNNLITLKGIIDYIQPEASGLYIPYGRRAIYIGNELYYIQDGIVASYNYKTFEQIDMIKLY